MSFCVRVVNKSQDGLGGVRVQMSFTDGLRGMTGEKHTDTDGYAWFDGYRDGEVKVFLGGSNYGIYRYRNGENITIKK